MKGISVVIAPENTSRRNYSKTNIAFCIAKIFTCTNYSDKSMERDLQELFSVKAIVNKANLNYQICFNTLSNLTEKACFQFVTI